MKELTPSEKQPAGSLVIVGLGLIGGSIALAARQRRLFKHIVGVGRDAARLQQAQSAGLIDAFSLDETAVVAQARLVVVCTPVSCIADDVVRLAPHLAEEAVITDAGSTKQNICQRIDAALGAGHRFVGSHPLAGSEKSGFEHARADLYEGATCVVTPAAQGVPALTPIISEFWTSLGAQVQIMSAPEHDLALAMTSHLPHLVASALASSVPEKDLSLAATGFADTTRIAAGNPELWTSIFMENSGAMLQAAAEFQHRLETLIAAIRDQQPDRLSALLTAGKRRRDGWNQQSVSQQ